MASANRKRNLNSCIPFLFLFLTCLRSRDLISFFFTQVGTYYIWFFKCQQMLLEAILFTSKVKHNSTHYIGIIPDNKATFREIYDKILFYLLGFISNFQKYKKKPFFLSFIQKFSENICILNTNGLKKRNCTSDLRVRTPFSNI